MMMICGCLYIVQELKGILWVWSNSLGGVVNRGCFYVATSTWRHSWRVTGTGRGSISVSSEEVR